MNKANRAAKAQIFIALFLMSCSLIFLQLGFTNFGGALQDQYFTPAIIPIAVTAFSLGTEWGVLQGMLTGMVLYAHASLQPIDGMELIFIDPPVAVIPLMLSGLCFGLLFSRLVRSESTGMQRAWRIALPCAIGVVLLETSLSFMMSITLIPSVPEAIASFMQYPITLKPSSLLCEILVVIVLIELTDFLIRNVLRSGKDAQLRMVFGSRLFGLLLIVFGVASAAGYVLITHFDLLVAMEETEGQLEAIVARLEECKDEKERAQIVELAVDTAVPETDGEFILLDSEGIVLVSSSAAYAKGDEMIDDLGDSLLPTIDEFADESLMDLLILRDTAAAERPSQSKPSHLEYNPRIAYVRAMRADSDYLIQIRTVDMVFADRNTTMLVMTFTAGASLVMAFIFASKLLKTTVEQPINTANDSLNRITGGDLNQEVQLQSSREFYSLSTYINAAVSSLKDYAAETERRIEQDLTTAKEIQESALPRTFPPFSGVDAFDVYASMNAAKYVGGDFYDLFRVDDHKLGFLIADVSGKGIPAALFMMRAKSHIATAMKSGIPLVQAVTDTNVHLCEDNDTCMFVTMWAATLDWMTGELTYVNAGHDIPLLRRNGHWQWLPDVGGPFLGAMDFIPYESATMTLENGDALFLYTDGVTEAMNREDQLFGKDRMVAFLERHANLRPHELDDAMRAELVVWADGADQSDDITMLVLEFG